MTNSEKYINEFADTFKTIVSAVILKLIAVTSPNDWRTTRDIMLTEINVPESAQKLLKHISEAPLGELKKYGMDALTIERAVFTTLILKGFTSVAQDVESLGFLDISEALKEITDKIRTED